MLDARFARRLRPDPAGAEGRLRSVTAPILDLTAEPDPRAERATQLLHGQGFTVLEEAGGFARGQAVADGYVGWVPADGLGPARPGSHTVTALSAHVYPTPSIKGRPVAALPYLSRVEVLDTEASFARIGEGWLCTQHLAPVAGDFVAEAERFLGVPYLWGGRSAWGIDCSSLVQLALAAAGIGAPRDSDMQEAWLGAPVAAEAPVLRGDLLFWKGHVGIALDADTLLHANAHAMAVTREPLAAAVARIAGAGGGPVTARRRLPPGDPGWHPPT